MKTLILILSLLLPVSALAARPSASSHHLDYTNVRVNSGSFVAGGQREPQITVCPNNNIFIAWIDTSTNKTHVSRSTDGGATWTDQLPAGTTGVDPAIVCDSQNRVYLSWLNGTLGVIRSDDAWASATLVTATGGIHSDKPFLAIGPSDELYITWAGNTFPVQVCSAAGYASHIYFQKSTDAGATFLSAVQLTGTGTVTNGRCTNAPMVVHPNGTIIVVLTCFVIDFDANPTCVVGNDVISGRKIYLTYSTDGGATFRAPVEFPTTDFTANAYMNLTMSKARLAVPFYPIMMSNGNLGMLWSCDTGTDIDVCYATSSDYGVTFSAAVKVNSDAAGTDGYHFWPAAAAGDSCRVYFIWQDTRSPGSALATTTPPTFQTYRADSNDCGQTFVNERIISPAPFAADDDNSSSVGCSIFISVAYRNGVTYWASCNTVAGAADIYFGRPSTRPATATRREVTGRVASP